MGSFADLILKHRGKRIVVMGGAPSLAEEIEGLQADVWISANEHGAKLRQVDYIVAMDERHGGLRVNMREHLRQFSDAPIIGPWAFNDYTLHTWPGSPRKGLSGMVATWAAWVMGGHPVILAGFDGYGGSKLHETQRVAGDIKGAVRVMGGALAKFWPVYDPGEKFGRYKPHSAILGLQGVQGEITIRFRKPTEFRGESVTGGHEVRVMRHEAARLLRHRMVEEI